jgi:acyl carrier protein
MSVINELESVFEMVFDQTDLQIKPETTSNEVEGWDSMSHVTLLLAVEDHFKIEFKSFEIANLKNVGALVSLVEKKLDEKRSGKQIG